MSKMNYCIHEQESRVFFARADVSQKKQCKQVGDKQGLGDSAMEVQYSKVCTRAVRAVIFSF